MSAKIQLTISLWLTSLASLLGVSYVFMQSPLTQSSTTNCQTVVTDPMPPLNVRSSPVVAVDNIVGTVSNGTQLQVVRQQTGWLQVQAPVVGWVAESMTTTTCPRSARPPQSTVPQSTVPQSTVPQSTVPQSTVPQSTVPQASSLRAVSLQIIDKAQDQFHAGQLKAAQTMLQTIPASDFHYAQAQATLQTMTAQWQQGDRAYRAAQTAIQQGHWQVVLAMVNDVPDVQYWRSRMAPIVKQAIYQQTKGGEHVGEGGASARM